MKLSRYSFGTGDRFGMQGSPQLEAIRQASATGTTIDIVWNKSHREHSIVGTSQHQVRKEADEAVQAAGWQGGYYVDADHINLSNVESFIAPSDFFTIDVADSIGTRASEEQLAAFMTACSPYLGQLPIEGIAEPLQVDRDRLRAIGENYLFAAEQAGAIFRHIAAAKGYGTFITEVSMDETDRPQAPDELFFILAMLAGQRVPVQTIAPKFTGRFNKGVDYQGDVTAFNREFSDDVCVLKKAVQCFGLPAQLKLSVHSGSDKFSIYPGIRAALETHGAGVHVKTAGTTWLEELIGLAEAGGDGLDLAKTIYRRAFDRFEELCLPYRTVIDIDRNSLPDPGEVDAWSATRLAAAIRHDRSCQDYDSNIRQLLHVGYKVAAELGDTYREALQRHRRIISRHVSDNLLRRHLKPLFLE